MRVLVSFMLLAWFVVGATGAKFYTEFAVHGHSGDTATLRTTLRQWLLDTYPDLQIVSVNVTATAAS